MSEIETSWARRVANEGAFLVHNQTMIAGKVVDFYDGVDRVYISPTNNEPVNSPVIKIGENILIANPNAFQELNHSERLFFVIASDKLLAFVHGALDHSKDKFPDIDVDRVAQILKMSFMLHIRAIDQSVGEDA